MQAHQFRPRIVEVTRLIMQNALGRPVTGDEARAQLARPVAPYHPGTGPLHRPLSEGPGISGAKAHRHGA